MPWSISRADSGHEGESFEAVYVRTWWDGAPANVGVRLLDFEIELPQSTENQALNWTVRITDADSDSASFSTGIDSNGNISTRPVNI